MYVEHQVGATEEVYNVKEQFGVKAKAYPMEEIYREMVWEAASGRTTSSTTSAFATGAGPRTSRMGWEFLRRPSRRARSRGVLTPGGLA